MVDLNITLWIQLANFLVTLVVLNYLLISPIRKIIRKRKDNVEGLIGEIEAFTAEKQQLLDAAVRADAGVTRRALQAKIHEFTEAAMAKLLA